MSERTSTARGGGGTHASEEEVRGVFVQWARAVAHCHARGVAHLDLKLDNAMRATSPATPPPARPYPARPAATTRRPHS